MLVGSLALAAVSSAATRPPALALTIAGSGTVRLSTGETLACSETCRASFRPAAAQAQVTALPAVGWQFTRWTGRCLGTRPTCTARLGAGAQVRAVFSPRQPAATTQPGAQPSAVTVTAGQPSEFTFRLSTSTVASGTVTFKVSNGGAIPHDFEICSVPGDGTANNCDGTTTPTLSSGASATLTVTFTGPGAYEYLCTVPGHAAAGMKGVLKVT